MRLLLRTLGPRAAVRQRLAGQLDEPVLVSLVQLLEPVHAGAMVSHMRGMLRMHANQPLVPQDAAGFGRVLWRLVLDYLLAERGSLFNRRSYVHSLLLGMAARYRMRYSELLATVLSHLSVRASATVRADSLAGILLSLSDQAWLGPAEDTPPATTPVLGRLLDDSGAAALASRLDGMDDAVVAPLLRQIGSDSACWTHAAAKLPPRLLTRLLAIAGKGLGSFAGDARSALHMLLAPHVGGGAATGATVAGYLLAALLQPAGQGALPAGRPRAVQLLRSMLSAACARFGLSYRAQLTRLSQHPVHGARWRNACNILLEEMETITPAGSPPADINAPANVPGEGAASAKTAALNQVGHDAPPFQKAGSAHADAAALALYYIRHGALPGSEGGASRPDLRALLRDPSRAVTLLSTADLRPDMIRRLLAHAPRTRLLALLAALYPGAIAMLTAFLDGCAALAQAGIGAGSGLRRTEAEALHWQLLLEALLDRHAPRLPVAELLAELGAQAARRLGVTRADYGLAWESALATRPAAPQAAAMLAQALGRIAGDVPTEHGIQQTTTAAVPGAAWPLLALMPEQGATELIALQAYLQFGTLLMERRSRGKAAQLQAHFAAALQAQPADLKQMLLQAAGNPVQRAQLASRAPRALQQAALQLLLGDAYIHSIRAINVLLQLPNTPWRAAELIALLLAAIHRRGGRRFDPGLFLLDVLQSRPELPETTATLALQQLRGAFAGRQDGCWRRHIDHVERGMATPRHSPAPAAEPVAAAAQAWRFPEPAAELPSGAVYYIANAGMVLLWPFLQQYFNGLGMLDIRAFRSPHEQSRAVYLLQYLASGSAAAQEPELLLNKLLCGMPGATALEADAIADASNIGDAAIGLSEQLLTGVTQNWPKLKNTSIRVLRESFLMREGRLSQRDDGWVLNVSSGPFDPLLQSLPWGLAVVRLPWMSHALWVEWKR